MEIEKFALLTGTRSAQTIMVSGFTAAQTGRTHDRTRPMLQRRGRRSSDANEWRGRAAQAYRFRVSPSAWRSRGLLRRGQRPG